MTRSVSTFSGENGPDFIKVVVKEGDDAILPCSLSTKENIVQKLFDWKKDGQKEVFMYDAGVDYNTGRAGQDEQFRGRVSHFPEQLEFGNASIVVRNTKDRKEEQIPGAAPEPSFIILNQSNDRALLQCLVRGAYPKPKLQWQDHSGNIVPAKEPQVRESGGRYDITLQTTVSKTDYYRCVAIQEEIGHKVYLETHIYIHEGRSTGSSSTKLIPCVILLCTDLNLLLLLIVDFYTSCCCHVQLRTQITAIVQTRSFLPSTGDKSPQTGRRWKNLLGTKWIEHLCSGSSRDNQAGSETHIWWLDPPDQISSEHVVSPAEPVTPVRPARPGEHQHR
ncbi:hypothetical protein Q5P01_001045 [Channa striata]|uniref:Ig-like domain-containing protein n=1 Tax=Channa striata TaxID=64152 RepID=A0AA88T3J6_CHASR|nr:hypothetical protein Q5P01_001045 [Channa striata]